MFSAPSLQTKFSAGLRYDDYVATGTDAQQANWQRFFEQVRLTPSQTALIGSFTRDLNVLVLSGVWCGDCVQQCPLLEQIARANSERIHLRFFDRDQHPELADPLRINGGSRVPVALFAAEDFEPVAVFGDRSLTRYRALAARQLGGTCPVPGAPVPADEIAGTLQDWIDEFERVQLLLRLSGRLKQKHGD